MLRTSILLATSICLALWIGLSGCGAQENPIDTEEGGQGVSAETESGETVPKQEHLPSARTDQEAMEPQTDSRMLIYEANLILEVERFDESADRLRELANAAGGFVASLTADVDSEIDVYRGSVTLRVPADRFDDTIAQIEKLARTVESKRIETSDVTEQYVDVEARLRAKRLLESRYLELLEQAVSVEDTLSVEDALAQVREAIERIEGRRRLLADRVAMSTIAMELHEPQPLLAAAGGGPGETVGDAFTKGLNVMIEVIAALIVFLIGALPIAAVTIITLWIVFAMLKRKRKRLAQL